MEHFSGKTISSLIYLGIWLAQVCLAQPDFDICDTNIDAALQRPERPGNIVLFGGHLFWEYDRRLERLVNSSVHIRRLWKDLPYNLNAAITLSTDRSSYSVGFFKDREYYFYRCQETLENCVLSEIKNIGKALDELGGPTFEAAFTYFPGMPKPRPGDHRIHVYLRNDRRELNCREPREYEALGRRFCEIDPLPRNFYKNFYKTHPSEQSIFAVESSYDRDRNETDFFVVEGQYLRYTYHGVFREVSFSNLFNCSTYDLVIMYLIAVVTIFQITILCVILILCFSNWREKEKKKHALTRTQTRMRTRA